jgi:hypothetical protein
MTVCTMLGLRVGSARDTNMSFIFLLKNDAAQKLITWSI